MAGTALFLYGTAGFRGKATTLPQVCYRVGVVAALRSAQVSQYTGIMVTASHNPVEDNGVKLVDSNGEMLAGPWETIAEEFVNSADLQATIERHFKTVPAKACVIVGGDARPSTEDLVRQLTLGVELVGGCVHNYGVLTTPLLQHLVHMANVHRMLLSPAHYYHALATDFAAVMSESLGSERKRYERQLTVDCSGGVGAITMSHLAFPPTLSVSTINTDPSLLNDLCGAEHVHKSQSPPRNLESSGKCAALDGDADRLIYFTPSPSFQMFDGERTICLLMLALKHLLKHENCDYQIGVVTTAYSNAAAINFLRSNHVTVEIQPTGVKYLHPAAKQYQIGVYFESNGHGTVLVQKSVFDELQTKQDCKLLEFLRLANQEVGDAVCDLLMVEAALFLLDMNLQDWADLYQPLRTRSVKIPVQDRSRLKTTYDETKITEPAALAIEIDTVLEAFSAFQGRAVIRASGTEPVIRIYTEGTTQEAADQLASQLQGLLERYSL